MTLKEDELAHFTNINVHSKNPYLQLDIFSKQKKELDNYQVLGSNAEDLRM